MNNTINSVQNSNNQNSFIKAVVEPRFKRISKKLNEKLSKGELNSKPQKLWELKEDKRTIQVMVRKDGKYLMRVITLNKYNPERCNGIKSEWIEIKKDEHFFLIKDSYSSDSYIKFNSFGAFDNRIIPERNLKSLCFKDISQIQI